MKYALEISNHLVVAIHSFDEETPIPQNLIPVETLEGIELGMLWV